MISYEDLALLHSTDDHEEAAEIVLECYAGVRRGSRTRGPAEGGRSVNAGS